MLGMMDMDGNKIITLHWRPVGIWRREREAFFGGNVNLYPLRLRVHRNDFFLEVKLHDSCSVPGYTGNFFTLGHR